MKRFDASVGTPMGNTIQKIRDWILRDHLKCTIPVTTYAIVLRLLFQERIIESLIEILLHFYHLFNTADKSFRFHFEEFEHWEVLIGDKYLLMRKGQCHETS